MHLNLNNNLTNSLMSQANYIGAITSRSIHSISAIASTILTQQTENYAAIMEFSVQPAGAKDIVKPLSGRIYQIIKDKLISAPSSKLSDQTLRELARKISTNRSSIDDVKRESQLLDEDLVALAPYLTYGDFINLNTNLIRKMLAKAPNLTHLYIRDSEIERLPDHLDKLTVLYCNGCTNLHYLPQYLPSAIEISCSGCPLKSLPDCLPKVEHLSIAKCRHIEDFPKEMPALRTINYTKCPLLFDKVLPCPQRGMLAVSKNTLTYMRFDELHIHELSQLQPVDILLFLRRWFLNKNFFPSVVFYEEKKELDGVDAGGLTNELFSFIAENLMSTTQASSGTLYMDSQIPSLVNAEDVETQRAYYALGSLMGYCFLHSYLLGNLFDERVYDYLLLMPDKPISIMSKTDSFDAIARKQIVNIYLQLKEHTYSDQMLSYIFDNDYKNLSNFSETLSIYLDEIDINLTKEEEKLQKTNFISFLENPKVHGSLKIHFIEEAMKDLRILALSQIQEGFSGVVEDFYDDDGEYKNMASQTLSERIQGRLTKERLLQNIKFESTLAKDENDEQIKNVHSFVKEWIENADTEQLELLVKIATASKTLKPHTTITFCINHSDENYLPSASSCFRTIYMPLYLTKEKFEDKFTTFLNSALGQGGFQLA